jgi:hypothetical protein
LWFLQSLHTNFNSTLLLQSIYHVPSFFFLWYSILKWCIKQWPFIWSLTSNGILWHLIYSRFCTLGV